MHCSARVDFLIQFVSVFFKWFVSIFLTVSTVQQRYGKATLKHKLNPGDQFNQENESCLFTLDFASSIWPFLKYCNVL